MLRLARLALVARIMGGLFSGSYVVDNDSSKPSFFSTTSIYLSIVYCAAGD